MLKQHLESVIPEPPPPPPPPPTTTTTTTYTTTGTFKFSPSIRWPQGQPWQPWFGSVSLKYLKYRNSQIKFCICHESTGIVTCAKFCCDHSTQTWIFRSRANSFCTVSIWDITILLVKRWPRCLPAYRGQPEARGSHDSTNFVNWTKDSFTVTLVSDMGIVFGALVFLKSAIRRFCPEDKLRQRPCCLPALRMSVYVWCCCAGLSGSCCDILTEEHTVQLVQICNVSASSYMA